MAAVLAGAAPVRAAKSSYSFCRAMSLPSKLASPRTGALACFCKAVRSSCAWASDLSDTQVRRRVLAHLDEIQDQRVSARQDERQEESRASEVEIALAVITHRTYHHFAALMIRSRQTIGISLSANPSRCEYPCECPCLVQVHLRLAYKRCQYAVRL